MTLKKNNRGQGTTEYIVILGIIVAIAVGLLYGPLRTALGGKIQGIVTSLS